MGKQELDYSERRKLMTVREDVMDVAAKIRTLLKAYDDDALTAFLKKHHPADLADAMLFLDERDDLAVFKLLDIAEAAEVLDEVDALTRSRLLSITDAESLAGMLSLLPSDEAADVVGGIAKQKLDEVLGLMDPEKSAEIRILLEYPKDTAGGIMSLGYVAVSEAATQVEAVKIFAESQNAEQIFSVFVTDQNGALLGVVDLRTLLAAESDTPIWQIMSYDLITVYPDVDQELVANIFARYDLTALPVVNNESDFKLIGVITADDIIDVIQEEAGEDVARMSGSDAQELENKSPAQVAMLRMPWIMSTMFIELLAGFVIHHYDKTLTKYILLASFMPIISAISGNTGLQSAAIIIRGLSTGHVQLHHWKYAVIRQLSTTVILGGACAATLGIIGSIWDHSIAFGVTVFLGMFLAVNIAGVVGTVVPLLSKRAGFDPALTAGPFETAFQDVIGISIFLSLATYLLRLFP